MKIFKAITKWIIGLRCPARLQFFRFEQITRAISENATGGPYISLIDGAPGWVLSCAKRKPRCQTCPRGKLLRERAAAYFSWQKAGAIIFPYQCEAHLGDRHLEGAEVDHVDGRDVGLRDGVTGDVGRLQKDRQNPETDPVAGPRSPRVENPQHGSQEPEDQTRDGGNQSY